MRNTLQTVCLVALAGCGGTALGPSAMTGEGFFLSGPTRLSYALDIPETGSPPYPMVVFGHDSSPEDKNRRKDWARRLVDNGVAVFRFDKRGVGDSGGVYRRGFVTSSCFRAISWRPWISCFRIPESTRLGLA